MDTGTTIPHRLSAVPFDLFSKDAGRPNQFYRLEALRLQFTARKNLYPMAAQQALKAAKKGFPVMAYELDSAFTVPTASFAP